MSSPLGDLRLIASHKGLCAVLFDDGRTSSLRYDTAVVKQLSHPLLMKAEKQLSEYFAVKRKTFDLKLDMRGTIFQQKAWKELLKIPYGTTISYGEQASRMGDPKKARAVGMANNRNSIAIVIPCHRVIGSDGKLVGYGGGLSLKERLLVLESA